MNIILVPGFTARITYLDPLRRRLEEAGHVIHSPGFNRNTMISGEFQALIMQIDSIPGSVVLIGHSAGGLLSVLAARKRLDVAGVIGLGSVVACNVTLDVPYYEARSLLGWLVPLSGPDEVKRFPVMHNALPYTARVQDWVLEKLEDIDA